MPKLGGTHAQFFLKCKFDAFGAGKPAFACDTRYRPVGRLKQLFGSLHMDSKNFLINAVPDLFFEFGFEPAAGNRDDIQYVGHINKLTGMVANETQGSCHFRIF